MSVSRWWLLVVSVALLLLSPNIPTVAQTGDDKARIASVLLTTPERCGDPCIWTLQPGVEKLNDFRQLTISLFGPMEIWSQWVHQHGSYANGVTLFTWARTGGDPNPVVDYVYVRVQPSVAQAAGIDITHFTPIAMIKALGNPDEAYLMFSRENLLQGRNRIDQYRLILVYPTRHAVYVILGKFRDYKACLISETAETITLYRFSSEEKYYGDMSIRKIVLGDQPLPPSIATTTEQTVADFTRMAQNPTTDCLKLKGFYYP